MTNFLSLALGAILLLGSANADPTIYFPPGTLDGTEQSSHFKEQWYSGQLRALKEPSLWELSKTQKTQTYRFLWLRSFDHPISVRLDIRQDGTALLTTKATSGQGGYKPAALIMNKTRALTKEQTSWALDRINEVGFWGLATYEKPKEGVVNLDGAQWILEGVKDGKYQVTDRWSPENGPIHTLGLMMLIELAQLKLLYQEVY
jgi:hypothetical protein